MRLLIAGWIYLVILVTGSYGKILRDCAKQNKNCTVYTLCPTLSHVLRTKNRKVLKESICEIENRRLKVCCPIDLSTQFELGKEITDSTSSKNTRKVANTTNIFPSRNICGRVDYGTDRIIGGSVTELDEFPWLARINAREYGKEKFLCGGSLITDRFVVTAGHCVTNGHNRTVVSVRLGEWNTETEKDCNENECSDPPIDVKITEVIVHPMYEYNKEILAADIALLRMAESVNYTDFIRPVCLPTTAHVADQDYVKGTTYTTAGWGVTEKGRYGSKIKLKVNLETVPMDVCRERVKVIEKINSQNVICAGGVVGKDTCNGDSGGPLVKEVTENLITNWYLYGITSFGANRCGSPTPAVYTRVVPYMDWITNVLRDKILN